MSDHVLHASPYYRAAAKALIKDDQDRLLVVCATTGLWELPGGGWEHHEPTIQDCMRREITEELGVEADTVGEPLFHYKGLHHQGNWKISFILPVTLKSTKFVFEDDDAAHAEFFTKEEVKKLKFSDDEAPILDHLNRVWP